MKTKHKKRLIYCLINVNGLNKLHIF